MSRAVFARFPNFDSVQAGAPVATAAPAPNPRDRLVELEKAHEREMEKRRREQDTQFSRQMGEVQLILDSLAGKVEKIEADARRQTAASIAAIAERLLPKLARRFLAEEIALHLEKMIPPGEVCIDIKAEPHLAEQLYETIQRSAQLADICNVIPQEDACGSRVDVSWKSGGLDFDFDGLLEACIGHLRSERPSEQESG
jgi:hypothetical protein